MTSMWRQAFFEQNFPIIVGVDFCDRTIFDSYNHLSDTKFDIVLSHHADDKLCADSLVKNLKEHIPNIKISLPINDKSLRLHIIDEGKMMVPLLSESYVKSAELMEEFHTALCRHRFSDEMILCPIIVGDLPLTPVYPQITMCLFSSLDKFWLTQLSGEPVSSCLTFAATVIANLLVKNPKVATSYKTLLSMKELEDWSYFKVRNGEDAVSEKSPILFTSSGSSHMIPLSTTVGVNTSSHGSPAPTSKNVNNKTKGKVQKNKRLVTSGHTRAVDMDDTSLSNAKDMCNGVRHTDEKEIESKTETSGGKQAVESEAVESEENAVNSIDEKQIAKTPVENDEQIPSNRSVRLPKAKSKLCSLS